MVRLSLAALVLFVALTASGSGTAARSAPIAATDTDGKPWTLLTPSPRHYDLLVFVAPDCPISNRYAPEITRICADYQGRSVRCFFVYPDAGLTPAAVSTHRQEYGLTSAGPAFIDRDHSLVRAAGIRVTPEAALYSANGREYRGRIDDWYVDVGRSRRQPGRRDVRLALDAVLAGRSLAQPETEAVGCFIVNP